MNTDNTNNSLAIPQLRPMSRISAALLDFSLTKITFSTLAVMSGVSYNFQYLIPLFLSFLYFVVGNSRVARGQTIGKLLFGLQTRSVFRVKEATNVALVDVETDDSSEVSYDLLTLPESALRYILQYGVIIALMGLPESIYSHFAFEASSWVLNFHIFICVAFIASSMACWIITPFHLAFHDVFAKSIVVPKKMGEEFKVFSDIKLSKRNLSISVICGIALGALFYVTNIDTNPIALQFSRYRYRLENTFSIHIAFKKVDDKVLSVGVVVLPDKKTAIDSWLASNLTQYAIEVGAIDNSKTDSVDWILAPLYSSETNMPKRFSVKTTTLDVTERPVEDKLRQNR